MQQPRPILTPLPPQFPASNITTEQIQAFLDENKKLILAILDNQNLGKLAECAQYQARLQQNLMYLAAIADAQPQLPTVHPQVSATAAGQQGGAHLVQQPVGASQQAIFAQRVPMQIDQRQLQEQQQLYQQHPSLVQAHLSMRAATSNGLNVTHADTMLGGSSTSLAAVPGLSDYSCGGGTGTVNVHGHDGGAQMVSGDGGRINITGGSDEAHYLRASEEGTT